jgi:DnaJ-class molecular chaperone
MQPRQRLIINPPDNVCLNCAGTGFLIVSHTSPDGYVEPNEIQECSICNGTGKRKTDKRK